jgi:dihydroorotase
LENLPTLGLGIFTFRILVASLLENPLCMKILISQATIVDKRHPDNGRRKDIMVEDGIISAIEDQIDNQVDEHISAEGLSVSIGWMDLRANFRDPGNEHKENLASGLLAAAAGGFTAVALSPDTSPVVDNKGAVEYLLNRSRTGPVEIVPIGAATKGLRGESLSEMYDMYLAGARAFGDCKNSLKESGMLHRALLYSKNFAAPVLHFPFDASLIPGGQMHEGAQSTSLGLRGIPAIAETLMVARDLSLLAYTAGRLHLGPLSTIEAVLQVQNAREQGLNVSCETTAAHLAYNDESLLDFDSAFKLMPPLRAERNRLALIEAIKNGHIQVLSSDHSPEDEEHKKLEFDYAAFGTAGIETFFNLVWKAAGQHLPIADLVATFSIHPREVLGIMAPHIALGEAANLSLFSTTGETHFAEKGETHKGERNAATRSFKSQAYNIIEQGHRLPGRVLGILNRGICHLNTRP